jgi:3-deoxy-7-phosphoheptulonate synthase
VSLAAVAAGAHGLIVEVHPHPDDALSDGAQSLDFATFDRLMEDLERLTRALARQPAPAAGK